MPVFTYILVNFSFMFQLQCSNLLRCYLILILSSQCFFLPWHLGSELCIIDSWIGNRRGTTGRKEANIYRGMPSMHRALSKVFSYILLPLILATCKVSINSTILTDGDRLVPQGVKQLVQSQTELELVPRFVWVWSLCSVYNIALLPRKYY